MNRGFIDALCLSVAVALLAGCGGSQPPIGAPGVMPQSRASALRTWKGTGRSDETIMYLAVESPAVVQMERYSDGKKLARLQGLTAPDGVCSDSQGNVFATDPTENNVKEYSHGGTVPIVTLDDSGYTPIDCSYDPTTRNLAVANWTASGTGSVAVYANEQGAPTYYPYVSEIFSCSYDNKGNLFVIGEVGSSLFAELRRGNKTFTNLSLPISSIHNVHWDGTQIALSGGYDPFTGAIYRIRMHGSTVKVTGTTRLQWPGHKVILADFFVDSGTVVAAFGSFLGYWNYPEGGSLIKHQKYHTTASITVSYPSK